MKRFSIYFNCSIIKQYDSEKRAIKFYNDKLKVIDPEGDLLSLYDRGKGIFLLSNSEED